MHVLDGLAFITSHKHILPSSTSEASVYTTVTHAPPFTRAPRSGLYPGFGVHTGTLTRVRSGFDPGSIRVRPGSNPGYRSGSGAGFRSGITIRLRHIRISSVRKWRRKDERGAIARRSCCCRYGVRRGFRASFGVQCGTTTSSARLLKTWQGKAFSARSPSPSPETHPATLPDPRHGQ